MSAPNDIFSPAQLSQLEHIVRVAVREELADAGLRIDDATHQDEAREDFRFLRKLRKGVDGTAAKIGWTVIAALAGGVLWILSLGLQFWKGSP